MVDTNTTVGKHIVLLGDSIFDNGRYVPGKPSLIEQLTQVVGTGNQATLLAHDGDVAANVAEQLSRLPAAATHLILSAGGNDALGHSHLLTKVVDNASSLFAELAVVRDQFRHDYSAMLRAAKSHGKPVVVCTIYDSNFEAPKKVLADVALAVWNDVILRCAGDAGVPVIDLRRSFTSPADYANPIEPSDVGGEKLARVIAKVVDEHDFSKPRTVVYG